jgi:hypothetical protein
MLRYTCLIKHAETLLRTKDCCTHSFVKNVNSNNSFKHAQEKEQPKLYTEI